MDRRDFLAASGATFGGLLIPGFGNAIAAEALLTRMDPARKKVLADIALEAATAAGASYCDVRIGRYLRQFVITRETRVQNVVNTESIGAGVRVIANGTWGFAATSDLSNAGIAKAAQQAVAIAKANSAAQTEPVRLAPVKGVGEVSWATPIAKNGMEVPVKDKVDLLLGANAAAMAAGANFVNSQLFLINEQKYFASTDGSYIDQDVHRIWPNFTVTAIDKASGKFRTRNALSSPMGMGYEYLDGGRAIALPNGLSAYKDRYDIVADAAQAARHAVEPGGAVDCRKALAQAVEHRRPVALGQVQGAGAGIGGGHRIGSTTTGPSMIPALPAAASSGKRRGRQGRSSRPERQ